MLHIAKNEKRKT